MLRTRWFYFPFAVMCVSVGCGDDHVQINTGGGGRTCGDEICSENQKCRKGHCVDVASPIDNVDNDGLCTESTNSCKNEHTRIVCVKGKAPAEENCEDGVCSEGECLSTQCNKTDEFCLNDSTLAICVDGEEMVMKSCSDEIQNGACRDNECIQQINIGDVCIKDAQCPKAAYCDTISTGTCTLYRTLGESCEGTDCAPGLTCLTVCIKEVSIGDSCDDYKVCTAGACYNGTCLPVSTEYGKCNSELACPEGTVCVDSVCVPTKGECTSNANCIGDSYCCLDESCGSNRNICVPYSTEKANDEACVFATVSGMFEASVQCYWEPVEMSASNIVVNSVAVGKVHNKYNSEKPRLVFVSSHSSSTSGFVLRILDSESCREIESIPLSGTNSVFNNVALADFDSDGYMEIVTYDANPVIYQWDASQKKHVPKTITTDLGIHYENGTVSIHDLDNDGMPEIIATNGTVVRADGLVLADAAKKVPNCDYTSPILGDLDGDGHVEFIADNKIYRWMPASNGWTPLVSIPTGRQLQAAYADFGTPGANASVFDFNHLDGRAEIVLVGMDTLQLWSVFKSDGSVLSSPQNLMEYKFASIQDDGGYPPAIGDFNGDNLPEIGVAACATFGVYDPKCQKAEANKCQARYVVWESATQDGSGIAGASAFDFDGDGKIEIVYGDECYTRVYDGVSGEVLFSSYRNSGTVIEYPVIADVDDDGSTEIVIVSDVLPCGISQDNSHRGVKCKVNSDCYSGSCVGGLCRCTSDDQCNWQTINGAIFKQYSCLEPLSGDTEGGNVCRAVQGKAMPGVTVLRDRLDRWVSSRPIWNQHAYNITNINDDGSIPKTSDWKQNFTIEGLNNYRQQRQGKTGASVAPDITGRFTSAADACKGDANSISLTAQVCNRGTKAVGAQMPAIFYKGSIAPENILCVSYTDGMVPVKECRDVSCVISKEQAEQLTNEKIVLVVNDDGKGGKTTVECNESNNTDEIVMSGCIIN